MFTAKKFLMCFELETGGILISIYCTIANVFYIIALFSLYQYVRVTKHVKDMRVLDKFKAMAISISVNFLVYHFVASILLSIGVRKVRKFENFLIFDLISLKISANHRQSNTSSSFTTR